MKKLQSLFLLLLLSSSFVFISCDDEDETSGPSLTGEMKVYQLSSVSNVAIQGTVTFAERSDNATVITIQLAGTPSGGMHPAHIHSNTAAEGGGIILDLETVDGTTGKSETVVTKLNNDTMVSYEDLLDIDGYVNVHLSATDLATLVAQGDVGQNELTGDSETYTLNAVSAPSISGTASFKERANGETLVTVQLTGTSAGGMHPGHIHMNTAAMGGGIAISLNDVVGGAGTSKTNVSELDNGTAITYTQMIAYNGYINIHVSMEDLATLVAQGNIGANAN